MARSASIPRPSALRSLTCRGVLAKRWPKNTPSTATPNAALNQGGIDVALEQQGQPQIKALRRQPAIDGVQRPQAAAQAGAARHGRSAL